MIAFDHRPRVSHREWGFFLQYKELERIEIRGFESFFIREYGSYTGKNAKQEGKFPFN
jgi:hypothetical protein